MRRVSLTLFALIALTLSAVAQVVNPVKWSVDVKADDANSGTIIWTAAIESGYHIYGLDKLPDGPVNTSITVDPVDGLTLEGALEPSRQPLKINDKMFALVLHEWEGTVSFSQKYRLDAGVRGVTVHSNIRYMACTDKACTPPKTESLSVVIGNEQAAAAMDTAKQETVVADAATAQPEESVQGQDQNWWAPVQMDASSFADTKAATSIWSLLLMGFLGGLLALLTPCVWPMIPMTLSFFLKKTKSRRRSIADALTYGLSIIVIFLVLGIAITLIFGAGKLNEIATSAVFNLIFFALLVVFAISFFGAFDIKLPAKWSNAVDSKAENTTGILSIFFMAFTLVLVSFSCTGPIIGTLLVQAASEGSILGPAVGMGGFALGLAIPFSLFAFFPSLLKEMPKSGGWMNSVKVVLGFVELILSLKFLSVADLAYGWRILDREVFVSIWIVLFVLLGIYLLGKLRFSHDSESKHTSVGGFFLAVISFSFAVYLLPGLWGAPLKSISAFAPPLTTQDFNLYGGDFKEFDNYDEGMAYAKENKLPVIVDFSGYACVNCRKMEGAVFDTDKVRSIIESEYVLIKLMVDEKANLDKPYTVEENGSNTTISTVGDKWSYLQRHKFGINSQPYYVLLDNDGNPLAPARVYDEDVDAFVDWLNTAVDSYKASANK
jgi:thiol:disulfide interchange protein DsbD